MFCSLLSGIFSPSSLQILDLSLGKLTNSFRELSLEALEWENLIACANVYT
jgi:hypothetical protein